MHFTVNLRGSMTVAHLILLIFFIINLIDEKILNDSFVRDDVGFILPSLFSINPFDYFPIQRNTCCLTFYLLVLIMSSVN